jgi:hypothetical protein
MDKSRVIVFVQKGEILPPPDKLAEIARKERGRVKIFAEGPPIDEYTPEYRGRGIIVRSLYCHNLALVGDRLRFLYSLAYLNSAAYACHNPRTRAAIRFSRDGDFGQRAQDSFMEFVRLVDPSDKRSYAQPNIHVNLESLFSLWSELNFPNPEMPPAEFITLKKELNGKGRSGLSPLVKALIKEVIDDLFGDEVLPKGIEDEYFGSFPPHVLKSGFNIPAEHSIGVLAPDALANSLKDCLRARMPIPLLAKILFSREMSGKMETLCMSFHLLKHRFDSALVFLYEDTARRYGMLDFLRSMSEFGFDLEVREENSPTN